MYCFKKVACAKNKSLFVGLVLLAVLVNCAWAYPAEDDSSKSKSTSSTTIKPVRHPNYVRLLKRTKNGEEIETGEEAGAGKDSAADASSASPSVATKTEKPADVIASVVSLPREKLTPEKIKEIIPYLEFNESGTGANKNRVPPKQKAPAFGVSSETERPRGLAGLFSLLTRPLNAIRNFGANRNRQNNDGPISPPILTISNRNTNQADKDDLGSSKNSTSTSSTKNSSSSNSNSRPGLFGSPGNFVLGMVKAVQNMTQTFESMVASFVKLFNFNNPSNTSNNNDGARGNRLFNFNNN